MDKTKEEINELCETCIKECKQLAYFTVEACPKYTEK